MKIRVKVYATLTKYVGGAIMHDPIEIDLPEKATLSDLFGRLDIPREEVKTSFVNSVMQPSDHTLSEGDDVGIFPPVGGG